MKPRRLATGVAWQQGGLNAPAIVRKATEDYLRPGVAPRLRDQLVELRRQTLDALRRDGVEVQ